MVGEIRRDGEFAAVQRGVAEAVDSVFSDDFQRDKISSGQQTMTFASTIFIRENPSRDSMNS